MIKNDAQRADDYKATLLHMGCLKYPDGRPLHELNLQELKILYAEKWRKQFSNYAEII